MIRKLVLSVLLVLCGCGGAHFRGPDFVNQTPQTDAFLLAQWASAQQTVRRGGEDLTRIRTIEHGTPPTFLVGDSRAATIQPSGLLVLSSPDEIPGMVRCPAPCDVSLAVAYSLWGKETVYAASWNQKPSDLATWLQYEFVSQILWQLGYDVEWR